MSYIQGEPCGIKWTDFDGKGHECIFRELSPGGLHARHICECSCGALKIRALAKLTPRKTLKLAHWKRGRKKVSA